jgi:hypothetical protein
VGEERDEKWEHEPTDPHADVTPPIMWPEQGSGFEADPFSPAGLAQQIWTTTGYRARRPVVRRLVQIVALVLALAFIAAQVAH